MLSLLFTGMPTLYNLTISLQMPPSKSSTNSNGSMITYTKKTGFRTIVLDLSPYTDRAGSHFSFLINGQRFNVKGNLLQI